MNEKNNKQKTKKQKSMANVLDCNVIVSEFELQPRL